MSPLADVVVVSYNSRDELRECIEPLTRDSSLHVIVVDNASSDDSLGSVRDLPAELVALDENGGFAHGCNEGSRRGGAPYVLFLNPDARIEPAGLARLVEVLEGNERAGLVAPRLVNDHGGLEYSQRRFPRLRSTYANALFLHRVLPFAQWTSELVEKRSAYERPRSPEWLSGACLMVRRDVLEQLGGWDERFFMYCEDKDLCRRARDAGYDIRFEPGAVAVHEGGGSAPRTSLMAVLAASRIRYAEKHRGRVAARLERAGIALGALTHMLVARGGLEARAGHAASLRTAARWSTSGA
jgi:N-acetylglucosaminyl-diphospho-decaprenol L-rhamnosyltransferase